LGDGGGSNAEPTSPGGRAPVIFSLSRRAQDVYGNTINCSTLDPSEWALSGLWEDHSPHKITSLTGGCLADERIRVVMTPTLTTHPHASDTWASVCDSLFASTSARGREGMEQDELDAAEPVTWSCIRIIGCVASVRTDVWSELPQSREHIFIVVLSSRHSRGGVGLDATSAG